MKTTQQWWKDVSNNSEEAMIDWLKDQYHGEVTAEVRIRNLIKDYSLVGKKADLISKIADDEKAHAQWVKQLLVDRGITAEVLQKEERYWDKVLPKEAVSFEYICAAGHLAETMRLERITLLSQDSRFKDIADVFSKILPDEVFHAKAFGAMSTPQDIEMASVSHNLGMNAIGLVA